MINRKLEKEIINLIPSKTLKDEIYMRKHKFSDLELAQIVIEFASTWKEMMDYLFKLKKEIKEAKVVEYISQYIEIEQKQYELLVANDSDYVYEVDMYPGSPGDKYLCPSYESAYITIGSYEKAYKEFIDIRVKNNIIISKCKVAIRENPEDIDEGEGPVYAVLNSDKEIKRIYSYLEDVDIEKIGIELNAIKYPDCFKEGDLVYINTQNFPEFILSSYNYYIEFDENKRYGINSFDNIKKFGEEVDECCFLDLSSEYVEYKKIENNKEGYCEYLMDHMHIDFGYLEKAKLEELPNKIYEDYKYAVETLNHLGHLKTKHNKW